MKNLHQTIHQPTSNCSQIGQRTNCFPLLPESALDRKNFEIKYHFSDDVWIPEKNKFFFFFNSFRSKISIDSIARINSVFWWSSRRTLVSKRTQVTVGLSDSQLFRWIYEIIRDLPRTHPAFPAKNILICQLSSYDRPSPFLARKSSQLTNFHCNRPPLKAVRFKFTN